MNDEMLDRLAIRDLLQNWVLWRDAGDCWRSEQARSGSFSALFPQRTGFSPACSGTASQDA